MLQTVINHVRNDARLIKQAWENMDTLSHVLVFFGVTLFMLSFDILSNNIHFH